MAKPSNYFWDYYFQAILTDDCREPTILQIRDALASLDDSNYEEVKIIVNYLLSETTYDDTPSTFRDLLRDLAKLNSRPAKGREVVPNEEIDGLVDKMCGSSMNTPEPSKTEKVALGLAVPDFVPSPDNPFYDPRLELEGAAHHVAHVFIAAKDAARDWHNMLTHQGCRFREYMMKMSVSPRHRVHLLIKDLKHMWEFLDNGRAGWRLINLPHNFYKDVLPDITELINNAQHVGLHKGCYAIRDVVYLAVDIRTRLGEFRKLRWEAEEACRREHEQQKTENEVKAEQHIENMMEKMSFHQETAGLLPVVQQEKKEEEEIYTVEKAVSDLELMGLMDRLEEELEEGGQAHVAPEQEFGNGDFDV